MICTRVSADDLFTLQTHELLGAKGNILTFSLTPASLRNLRSFSSRSVRRQNIEWSKGIIFFIATLRPARLDRKIRTNVESHFPWCRLSLGGGMAVLGLFL